VSFLLKKCSHCPIHAKFTMQLYIILLPNIFVIVAYNVIVG
jgi:hypothetical protein